MRALFCLSADVHSGWQILLWNLDSIIQVCNVWSS